MKRLRMIGAALALSACMIAPVHANDIQPFTTIYGTDWTYAGVGQMRDGTGAGNVTLSGISGPVSKAYLYWHGPTNSSDPLANASVTFNGTNLIGTNIGFSSDNCWGYANSQAYRADITSLVSGNGSYALSNFRKSDANINGASVVTFFNDGNAANNRDVVIFDGNDSNIANTYDANGWNVSLPGINYSGGAANLVLGVSDGQQANDDALILNGGTLVPTGPIFEGALTGGDGVSYIGSLWDINSYDVTSYLSPGLNALTLTSGQNSDCLSLVHAMIDLPAGAAPPPSDVPEPGAIVTGLAFFGGIGLAAVRSRRRKA